MGNSSKSINNCISVNYGENKLEPTPFYGENAEFYGESRVQSHQVF